MPKLETFLVKISRNVSFMKESGLASQSKSGKNRGVGINSLGKVPILQL